MTIIAHLLLATYPMFCLPAHAAWRGKEPLVVVRILPRTEPISMHESAPIALELSVPRGSIRVTRFMSATRGVAFVVKTRMGDVVGGIEPPYPITPPPPLKPSELTLITKSAPFTIRTSELSRQVFPGPGTYQVSARIVLINIEGETRLAELESPSVTVEVVE